MIAPQPIHSDRKEGSSTMNITDIRVFRFEDQDRKSKAVASITIDDCFVVRDLRIIEAKEGGLTVVMPSRKVGEKFRDIAHPINNECRLQIVNSVMEVFNKKA